MKKTLIVFSLLNIAVCALIAYWVPTAIMNSFTSQNVSPPPKQSDSLADLHIAIEQTRAMIYQQASQWEIDRQEFNHNRHQINEIIIELGSRLDSLEDTKSQSVLANTQSAPPSSEKVKQAREANRLNTWRQDAAPVAMDKVINNSEKIAKYIKDNLDISDSEYVEVSEIIRLSLVEAADVISNSSDFKNLEQFNQLIADINSRKEERIRQALSPEMYAQYKKIGWMGATDSKAQ